MPPPSSPFIVLCGIDYDQGFFFAIISHSLTLSLTILLLLVSIARGPLHSYLQVTPVLNLPSISPNHRIKTCLFLGGQEREGKGMLLALPATTVTSNELYMSC